MMFRNGPWTHAKCQFGRSILQVVGSMVAGVSIFAASFQPKGRSLFPGRTAPFSWYARRAKYRSGWKQLIDHLAHQPLAAVQHLEFYAFECHRDHLADRVDRLGLVGRGRQHAHLVDGTRIEQAEVVFGAERFFKPLRARIVDIRNALVDLEHLVIEVGLLDGGRSTRTAGIIGVPARPSGRRPRPRLPAAARESWPQFPVTTVSAPDALILAT